MTRLKLVEPIGSNKTLLLLQVHAYQEEQRNKSITLAD